MTATTGLTPPGSWHAALQTQPVRPIDPAAFGRLVVVAAHPDDETLAVGGLMQAVHAAGGQVELVVATDGDAAFPGLGADAREALGRARRAELTQALRALGLGGVAVHWLGMPDSALEDTAAAEALAPLLREADSCLAPWVHDPHPDHAAAGRASAAAAPPGARRWAYPIWMWAWQQPDDPRIPWAQAFTHVLDDGERDRKNRAIGCFTSQVGPAPDGGPPVLPAQVLRYFGTGREVVFRTPPAHGAPVERFAELYARTGGDPWSTRSSWYEARKRAVVLACLPRERYRFAAEPGCGTGELTRELAGRCDRVQACDFTAAAVEQSTAAVQGLPGVTVEHAALPGPAALPAGIDLAVLSEVLYYLTPADIDATAHRLAYALAPGGDVVLVHWRGDAPEAPQDAAAAHRRLVTDDRFEVLVDHTDAEFLLHVLRRR